MFPINSKDKFIGNQCGIGNKSFKQHGKLGKTALLVIEKLTEQVAL